MSKLIVHKYGSSVLFDESQLESAVDSIYASVRDGYRVIAVVSAMGETTDGLLEEAKSFGEGLDDGALAMLLSTGELRSASLLTFALGRAGVSAQVMDAGAMALRTAGSSLDAEPVSVGGELIRDRLERASVLVVPGFLGRGREGETTLLGRGGSDLTALFLAAELAADCVLFKDVDGIYESDPNASSGPVRRYQSMTWEVAEKVGGRVLQPKAIAFAREKGLDFSVKALGADVGTDIGRHPVVLTSAPTPRRPLRVALLGLGTVGLGVYRRLSEQPELFEVVAVAVRDGTKVRPADVDPVLLTTDIDQALAVDHEITVEVMGGLWPARRGIEASLGLGRLVVTANKDLVAEFGQQLEALAARSGGKLAYGAAVGGAVPCVEAVERLADTHRVTGICGVLNGTTNYVLDAMGRGDDFESALQQAQAAGFAEADPSADIEGLDAARKLVILMRCAFGSSSRVEDIACEGIVGVTPEAIGEAKRKGGVIRLVARCKRGPNGLEGKVGPEFLPLEHPLAQVGAEGNAIELCTDAGLVELWSGAGAGRWPTTQAVVGDILHETVRGGWAPLPRARVA